VICFALYPTLAKPDEAYLTMVTNLFPIGMVGLVFAVLTAALVSTIGSALNALSTVFTMDIYVKRIRPQADTNEIVRMGRIVTIVGAILSIAICLAIDNIKGLNLFNVFQSILGFIAPPMTAVFLFGIFWRRATTRAANFALTIGTAICLTVGILYLWVLPAETHPFWPHFMMLSFLLFVLLGICMMFISLCDSRKEEGKIPSPVKAKTSPLVIGLWTALVIVMVVLYTVFN
jgi:SSS family solute:Na+ symporter